MDLFELLFIALFILFPVMDGILKKRRKSKGPGRVERGGADAGGSDTGEEPRTASDMVPDDLWELMTGEQRDRETQAGEPEAPWSADPGQGGTSPSGVSSPGGGTGVEAADDGWRESPAVVDDEAEVREPVSAEYEGPEAYSLETPAPEPLERRVPSAKARHRAFHELIDRPKPKRKQRMSPLIRSLRSPDGLRQAVLLKEVLGPPKGLE